VSRKTPALIAIAATVAVTLAVLTTTGGAQAPTETVLSYTFRSAGGTFVDSKPKGDSRGDFVVFEDRLLTGKRVVGRERGTCFVANARTHVTLCTMGWVLPDGTLTTAGATGAEPPFTMPITGGTGRFAGARGTARVQPSKVTFRLLP
jgi:hypothetical protein